MQVIVLVEQPLSAADAAAVVARRGRPPAADDQFHVLIPVEDAAARVEATIGTLATTEVLGTSPLYFAEQDLEKLREEIVESSRRALQASVEALRAAGVSAGGEVTAVDPLDRLCQLVEEKGADEVVIVTRPHLVADLLHVDWTSKARRRLSVPCVHLIAQRR